MNSKLSLTSDLPSFSDDPCLGGDVSPEPHIGDSQKGEKVGGGTNEDDQDTVHDEDPSLIPDLVGLAAGVVS